MNNINHNKINDLDAKIKNVIIEYVENNISFEDIKDDTNIFKEYSLDSIKAVNIISDIEMLFDISFPHDGNTIEILKHYKKIREYVAANMK